MSKEQISPTVYGIETEYSCVITLPGAVVHEIVGKCHSADTPLDLYAEPLDKGSDWISYDSVNYSLEDIGLYRNSSGMLSNGGRFYMDPSGPEYATPEHTTAESAVHAMFDGDEIVQKLFRKLQNADIIEGFQINRRIVDHNRTSRGIHINTATNIEGRPSYQMISALSALNVAKGAIFGSGGLLVDEHGKTAFYHSPRLALTDAISHKIQPFNSRPLVRQPFKADEGCSRIETISGDALNFAWPMRASMVVTNALVSLIELGETSKLPVLRNPIRASHTVGKHGNRNTISLKVSDKEYNGVRPLEIIQSISELALETHDDKLHLDEESLQVLVEIIEVADIMKRDLFAASPYVESVARLLAMKRKMESSKLSWNSEKLCRFDYYWDKIGGGFAETLRQKNKAGWLGFTQMHSENLMKKRMVTPPSDTRAAIRGQLILESFGKNKSDWFNLDIDGWDRSMSPLSNSIGSYPHKTS